MNFLDNITFRRRRTDSDINTSTASDHLSDNSMNKTTNSMPSISDDENDEIIKLKNQIDKLTADLNSARIEINSLKMANKELKQKNEALMRKNELHETFRCSPSNKHQPAAPVNTPNNCTLPTCKTKTHLPNDSSCFTNTLTTINVKSTDESVNTKQSKQKVCIISANKYNKILKIAQNRLHEFDIIHYIITNAGILQMLDGIDSKLADYTMQDYCIIQIGQEDFASTNDYFKLIFEIRNTLKQIKHTNLIICLPTFKHNYQSNMFNWRIENFNNLLYLDILTNEHAYIIDSNKHLKYDYSMYNRVTGNINNYAMDIIFQDINDFIQDLKLEASTTFTSTENEKKCFFR